MCQTVKGLQICLRCYMSVFRTRASHQQEPVSRDGGRAMQSKGGDGLPQSFGSAAEYLGRICTARKAARPPQLYEAALCPALLGPFACVTSLWAHHKATGGWPCPCFADGAPASGSG